jgi:hypothetical protein
LWGELAAYAVARGAHVSLADVCALAAGSGQLSGAWVTASAAEVPAVLVYVTDPVCEQLAELQLTLGEGPCRDVLASAAPVLSADLADAESGRRWPAFAPEARARGAEALFAFPLIVGAIRAGVMALYRSSAGPLTGGQFGDLLIFADMATLLLLDSIGDGLAAESDDREDSWLDGQPVDLAMHRAEIDQATGMLTVQLGVSITDAFVRLRAYAYSRDRRLADVASDIVARRLRLDPDPVPNDGPGP